MLYAYLDSSLRAPLRIVSFAVLLCHMDKQNSSTLEGQVKIWQGKKWKEYYCLLRRSDSSSDVVELFKFKNQKLRRKWNAKSNRLIIKDFLGMESGFALEKETDTLAVLYRPENVLALAFDRDEQLTEWSVWLRACFGYSCQYRMQVTEAPAATRLDADQYVRLHLTDGSVCLSHGGSPPRIAVVFDAQHIRRFCAVQNQFIFRVEPTDGKIFDSTSLKYGQYTLLSGQAETVETMFRYAVGRSLHRHLFAKATRCVFPLASSDGRAPHVTSNRWSRDFHARVTVRARDHHANGASDSSGVHCNTCPTFAYRLWSRDASTPASSTANVVGGSIVEPGSATPFFSLPRRRNRVVDAADSDDKATEVTRNDLSMRRPPKGIRVVDCRSSLSSSSAFDACMTSQASEVYSAYYNEQSFNISGGKTPLLQSLASASFNSGKVDYYADEAPKGLAPSPIRSMPFSPGLSVAEGLKPVARNQVHLGGVGIQYVTETLPTCLYRSQSDDKIGHQPDYCNAAGFRNRASVVQSRRDDVSLAVNNETRLKACSCCRRRRDYMNQRFIDSLQSYYNVDGALAERSRRETTCCHSEHTKSEPTSPNPCCNVCDACRAKTANAACSAAFASSDRFSQSPLFTFDQNYAPQPRRRPASAYVPMHPTATLLDFTVHQKQPIRSVRCPPGFVIGRRSNQGSSSASSLSPIDDGVFVDDDDVIVDVGGDGKRRHPTRRPSSSMTTTTTSASSPTSASRDVGLDLDDVAFSLSIHDAAWPPLPRCSTGVFASTSALTTTAAPPPPRQLRDLLRRPLSGNYSRYDGDAAAAAASDLASLPPPPLFTSSTHLSPLPEVSTSNSGGSSSAATITSGNIGSRHELSLTKPDRRFLTCRRYSPGNDVPSSSSPTNGVRSPRPPAPLPPPPLPAQAPPPLTSLVARRDRRHPIGSMKPERGGGDDDDDVYYPNVPLRNNHWLTVSRASVVAAVGPPPASAPPPPLDSPIDGGHNFFRFPSVNVKAKGQLTEQPAVQLNYCELALSASSDDDVNLRPKMTPNPQTATMMAKKVTKPVHYVQIDAMATIAVAKNLTARANERRDKSSSSQTLSEDSGRDTLPIVKKSTKKMFLARGANFLRRRTSLANLTHHHH